MKAIYHDIPTLKWIYQVMKPDKKWAFWLIVLRVLLGLEATLTALAIRDVISVLPQEDWKTFGQTIAWLLALAVIGTGLQTVAAYCEYQGTSLTEKHFRARAFSELMRRSYSDVSSAHSGDWLTRVYSDSLLIAQSLLTVFPKLIGLAVQMISALCALFAMLPLAAGLMILGCALLAVILLLFRAKLKAYHKQIQSANGEARSFMQERLSGLLIVRAFTQEENVARQAQEYLGRWTDKRERWNRLSALYQMLISGATRGGYLVGIVLCGVQLLRGRISYDTLAAVLLLIRQAGTPLTNLSGFVPQYYAMLASAERMMEIEKYPLDHMDRLYEKEYIQQYYQRQFCALDLRDLCFSYGAGQETVLDGFNMEIQKGQFVALAGESGCGKSTVLKLIISLYQISNGEVQLRDGDGTEHPLNASWRGLFAYVPQGNQLLSGTIREAVTFGEKDQMERDEAIWRALRIACAEDFVRELPDGLDSVVGERGAGFSEGQIQRLAVARAIFSERPVLILDEATSALDMETERQLLANLRAMTDRTILIVTHRPAALSMCDRVYRFQDHSAWREK